MIGQDQPWPVPDLLRTLADAYEHLSSAHLCDCDRWETFRAAADAARGLVEAIERPLALGHAYRARRAWDDGPVDDACFELVTDLAVQGGRAFCLKPEAEH